MTSNNWSLIPSKKDTSSGVSGPESGVFLVHIGSFTVYNGIVGYLLHNRNDAISALLFAVAMALHFVVNDYGLRKDYEHLYHDIADG